MDITSNFPEQIDDLIFYQDINLSKSAIISQYQTLLNEGHYSQASQLLKNSGAFYYGADLFNLLENRIFNLQKYVKEKTKVNPHIFSSDKPANYTTGTMWIGGEIHD